MRQRITCPESAHLEEIEFEVDPVDGHILGLTYCSVFGERHPVECLQECARRLNRRTAISRSECARHREQAKERPKG